MDDVVKKEQTINETKDFDVNTMNVSRKERIAFYFASFFRDMSYAIVGGFLLLFYIDIMGFAGTAALIFIPIINRIWDGVNDPLLGAYFDRRQYTNEKAKPIFKNTVLICAIMLIMMFYAPTFSQNKRIDYVLKCIYAIFTYGIFEALQTLNGTAFMTLYNSISANPAERTYIISRARLFSTMGTYIVYGGIPIALSMFRNDDIVAKTYIYLGAAILISLCFVIYNFLMYRYVKERGIIPSQEKQKILPMLKKFTKNKLLILMIISTSLANFINLGSIQLYFFTYNMGNPALQTILVAITLPTFFIGGLITPALVKRFNKRELMIASSLAIVVVNSLFLLGGYKPPIWVILLILLANNFPLSVKGVLYWSMISDTVDYGEWKTHVRNDGLVYAIEGAAMKIIGSVGAMFVGIVITIINFVPNALTQTEATMRGLFFIPQLTIITITLLSIIPLLFYDLDKKKHAMILAELKERKEQLTQ
jgi:GPH family glycoside/pentoside/hexuronide:cation symporter/probable glucitol transport protein GutA